jgi:hypothetical protein
VTILVRKTVRFGRFCLNPLQLLPLEIVLDASKFVHPVREGSLFQIQATIVSEALIELD